MVLQWNIYREQGEGTMKLCMHRELKALFHLQGAELPTAQTFYGLGGDTDAPLLLCFR